MVNLSQTLHSKLVKKSIPNFIQNQIPPLIIKDLASFRLGLHQTVNVTKTEDTTKTFLKIPYSQQRDRNGQSIPNFT